MFFSCLLLTNFSTSADNVAAVILDCFHCRFSFLTAAVAEVLLSCFLFKLIPQIFISMMGLLGKLPLTIISENSFSFLCPVGLLHSITVGDHLFPYIQTYRDNYQDQMYFIE